jgi:proteasome lid subunit RPN8/RPN11
MGQIMIGSKIRKLQEEFGLTIEEANEMLSKQVDFEDPVLVEHLPEDIEVYMLLVGQATEYLWWGKGGKKAKGNKHSVAFNADQAIKRDEEFGDVIGFYHTHPNFLASPSIRDDLTMWAWVACLGKPLICVIKGVDGTRAWLYKDDESDAIECSQCKKIGKIIFGAMNWDEEDFEEIWLEGVSFPTLDSSVDESIIIDPPGDL